LGSPWEATGQLAAARKRSVITSYFVAAAGTDD